MLVRAIATSATTKTFLSLLFRSRAIALSGNIRGDRLQKSNNALLKRGDRCLHSLQQLPLSRLRVSRSL
ncbi:hypothetical protein NIES4106_27380 [Fischerella sp. NIES-4106]|jgi:hypothetical protein|nr:hypothetical protein NIES4106_27380 [Fischerella sp. NIES-4106]